MAAYEYGARPAVTRIASDTGFSGADAITSDQTLVIHGTAEGNSTVTVVKNGTSIGTTRASSSGAWTFDDRGTVIRSSRLT